MPGRLRADAQTVLRQSDRALQLAERILESARRDVPLIEPARVDLAGLIDYDPQSQEARDLSKLTSEILRPKDPANPTFRSAKDILHGIERIQLGQLALAEHS